jgi:nanoRNase/pAp phosphatase (c-di-AMP/oligoRNAs hydrolase)
MQISPQPQQALDVINESQSLCLITDSGGSVDSVSAMLAFYHLFKKYKKIRIVVPEEVPPHCHSLPESSIIERTLGPKKLSINLDTNGVVLEKVSYLMEGRTFKMILHPQTRSFEVERVSYEYLGFSFDLFMFFGVENLGRVGPLFNYDFSEVYKNASINFDTRASNESFGSINIIDSGGPSICEILFKMIGYWKLNFDRDVSLCLLNGLAHFQSSTPNQLNSVFHKGATESPDKFLAIGGL